MNKQRLQLALDTADWLEGEIADVTRKLDDMFFELRLVRGTLEDLMEESESEVTDDELLVSQVPLGDGSV